MLTQTASRTGDAQNVDMRELSAQVVDDVQSAKELARRAAHRPKIIDIITKRLGTDDFRAWIWDDKSFAVGSIVDGTLHGKIVNLIWVESHHPFGAKRYLTPAVLEWGREMGAYKVLTIVHEEGPWVRASGMKPWGLVLVKEIEDD